MLPMKFPVFLEILTLESSAFCAGLRFYVLLSGVEFAALHVYCFLGRSMTANQDLQRSTGTL